MHTLSNLGTAQRLYVTHNVRRDENSHRASKTKTFNIKRSASPGLPRYAYTISLRSDQFRTRRREIPDSGQTISANDISYFRQKARGTAVELQCDVCGGAEYIGRVGGGGLENWKTQSTACWRAVGIEATLKKIGNALLCRHT